MPKQITIKKDWCGKIMKIFYTAKIPKKYRNSALAIGNFDGVHLGHQKVFSSAKKFAKKN